MRRTDFLGLSMIGLVVIGGLGVARGQQQGGGPAGGMGMRGAATAQPMLLQVEGVQKELGLSAEQVKDARKLGEEYQAEVRERLSKLGFNPMALQDLPAEERFARFREMAQAGARVSQEAERGFRTKLDLLLEPSQSRRLGEIQIQALGVGALRVDDVAMKLDLSKEQKERLERIEAESREAMASRFQQSGGAAGGDFAKGMREARAALEAKTMDVLTDKQKQALAGLKGKAFDLSVLRPANGGGGRPMNN